MKISTKGRYGLRIMLELAQRGDGPPVTVRDVAHSQDLSEKYVEQIMNLLRRGGMVESRRGAAGGYSLAMPAQKITVGAILRITEGEFAPVHCVGGEQSECPRSLDCPAQEVWRQMKESAERVADSFTLSDLVKNASGCQGEGRSAPAL